MRDLEQVERELHAMTVHWEHHQRQQYDMHDVRRHAIDWVVLPPWYHPAEDVELSGDRQEQLSLVAAPRTSRPPRPRRSGPPQPLQSASVSRPPHPPASISPTRVRSHLRLLRRHHPHPRGQPKRSRQSTPSPPSAPQRSRSLSSPAPLTTKTVVAVSISSSALSRVRHSRLPRPTPRPPSAQRGLKAVEPTHAEERSESEVAIEVQPYPTATQRSSGYPVPSAPFLKRMQAWQAQSDQRRQRHQQLALAQSEQRLMESHRFRPAINRRPPRASSPLPPTALLHTHSSLLSFSRALTSLLASPSPTDPPSFRPHLVSASLGGGRVERTLVDRSLRELQQRTEQETAPWTMGAKTRQLANDRERRRIEGGLVQKRIDEGLRMHEEQRREWTFHPRVSEESLALTSHLPTDFLARQSLLQREEDRRERERTAVREEEERAVVTFRPVMPFDVRREKAMEGQPIDPVHRLHDREEHRRRAWEDDEVLRDCVRQAYPECSFAPRISRTSTVLAHAHRSRQSSPTPSAMSMSESSSAASKSLAGADGRFEPRVNAQSQLLCLGSGGLLQHQWKSEAFHQQLADVYDERRVRDDEEEAKELTFEPATTSWDRESAAVPRVVHGVERFLTVRRWAEEQRRWKVQREREVFLLDAAEGPGRRGATEVREFHLQTDRRGAAEQARIERERAARRNRVLA